MNFKLLFFVSVVLMVVSLSITAETKTRSTSKSYSSSSKSSFTVFGSKRGSSTSYTAAKKPTKSKKSSYASFGDETVYNVTINSNANELECERVGHKTYQCHIDD